jgi:hypothetical protein
MPLVYPSRADLLTWVIATLRADATLLALVPAASIWNHVPQDKTFPYVRAWMAGSSAWDTQTSNGLDEEVQVDAWTERHGDLLVLQIADAVRGALHLATIALPAEHGQGLLIRYVGGDAFLESDGESHRTVSRFRILATA